MRSTNPWQTESWSEEDMFVLQIYLRIPAVEKMERMDGMELNVLEQESRQAKNLRQVKCGERVTVSRLEGCGAVKRRIMDMGITKGTEIFVRKVAPLGDPIEVTVRGYELSLRKADAEMIQVR